MVKIKTNIHSQVAEITNSSTVIYIDASKGSIETLKKFITGILKVSGSDKTADDLFSFKLLRDYYDAETEDSVCLDPDTVTDTERYSEMSDHNDMGNSGTVIISSKSGKMEDIDVVRDIFSAFNIDGGRDG